MAVFGHRQFGWSAAKILGNVKIMSEMMDCAVP